MAPHFSVVIPTCNMHEHIPALWASLQNAGISRAAECIVFVDDGSTDATPDALRVVVAGRQPDEAHVEVLTFAENKGRFVARLEGAKAAPSERVLFLDTRLELPSDFALQLLRASETYPAINGTVEIDTRRNVFCLYWDRSHKVLFRNHYAHAHAPITLTPQNFDAFLKGTTVFYCPRAEWIAACDAFEGRNLLSDDTFLMRKMVETCPITIHPDVKISWVPRETFSQFVWRIWDRGPGFAEYHVYERRGPMFWAVAGGFAALLAWAVMLAVAPIPALLVAVIALGAVALSTAFFAQGPMEFVKMVPLHVATFFAFGMGALRGIVVVGVRKMKASRG